MFSGFFREGEYYSVEDFKRKFGAYAEKIADNDIVSLFNTLAKYGVIRKEKGANDKELPDSFGVTQESKEQYKYVINYVGIVVYGDFVLKCYPKYITEEKELTEKLKKVISVIERYKNRRGQSISSFLEDEIFVSNELAIMLAIIKDYFENGIYSNEQEIIENNGSGEIYWDKVINETLAIIKDGQPYYTELKNRRRISNSDNYISHLHRCILTEISAKLSEADLLELFGMPSECLSDEQLYDFGDEDYILYRIEREMHVQFNTRRLHVLKMMYAYINSKEFTTEVECKFYGTTAFNMVWEDVCAQVLDSRLDDALLAEIEKPKWEVYDVNGNSAECYADTLKPDAVSETQQNLFIFDAKYYVITTTKDNKTEDNKIIGQPGVESIIKQYCYERAYEKYAGKHGKEIINCFLCPSEETVVRFYAKVSMEQIFKLPEIKTYKLPADQFYDKYIRNEKWDLEDFIT